MAPPPVRIVEAALSVLEHRVMAALCDAGVPDALDRPMSLRDLALAVDVEVDRLERMIRFGAARGWLSLDRLGLVKPTPVTDFLRSDHPGGWRAWIDFAAGGEVVAAVAAFDLRSSTDPFEGANGAPFFEWMAAHPGRGATFDRAMAAGGRMHALGLAAAVDWKGSKRVCDVGGGTGVLLATLIDSVGHLHGAVFDLPEVIARATDHPRMARLAGDAFVEVPSGFDTYLLVNVLHDWSDSDAIRLLTQIRRVLPLGGRVIVVENSPTRRPQNDIALSADLLMAALTPGGRERSAEQFAALGRSAGLICSTSHRLASADIAHIFVSVS